MYVKSGHLRVQLEEESVANGPYINAGCGQLRG